MLPASNLLEPHLRIGLISAQNVVINTIVPRLENELKELLSQRKQTLTEQEDRFRKACRDMLRIGSYKPTGRSKPASEYLLRAASDDAFPRINSVADINNVISLKYVLPISLWDTDRIITEAIVFRVGTNEESFAFNPSGQRIDLLDLVAGFAVNGEKETPIITPVKDCQRTKTHASTKNIAVAIYYPGAWNDSPYLEDICVDFSSYLKDLTDNVQYAIL